MPTVAEALGQQQHHAGDQADAWYLLGAACKARGKLPEAVTYYRRAIHVQPALVRAHNGLGITFVLQGNLPAAVASFRRAVQLQPDHALAHNNLGNALKELGRVEEAVPCYQQAIRLRPDFAEAHSNLGDILALLGRFAEAEACCREALRLRPDSAEAHNNLGIALAGQHQWQEARASYQQAIQLQPNYGKAHNNLGALFAGLRQHAEAVVAFRQALRCQPDSLEALANLGRALGALDPASAEAQTNQGLALADRGQHEAGLARYQQALQLDPNSADAHRNRALTWLLLGNLAQGWQEFEWRWQGKELPRRPFPQPEWEGSPLAGRTILLHAEQGLGDTLQFIRYAPLVKQHGGTVVLACQRALLPLLADCAGIDHLAAQGDALPPFDVHAPLLSLPRIFGTTLASIPAPVPYLHAQTRLVEQWRRELAGSRRFKIGIVWQGSARHRRDHDRSLGLAHFEPLARVPGVQLVSLQKGAGLEQLPQVAGRFPVTDLGSRLDETTGSFLDTAAVLKSLDLLVTCDSAVGHLAGALSVPTWLALMFNPDWRWLLEREDSPWYPNHRLFRQERPGDWGGVTQRMAATLRTMVGQHVH